jgi:uncharacterized protein (TIGR03435 family)
MTDMLARALLFASGSLEWSIVVKATVVLGLGLVGARLAHRARASVRHVILATTFGGLVVLPVATALMPRVAVGVPTPPASPSTSLTPAAPYHQPIAGSGDALRQPLGVPRTWPAVSAATVARAIWLVGALLCLLPVTAALLRLRRVRRRGVPWLPGDALIQALATTCGITRPLDVLVHEDAAMPMMYGLWHPVILLPMDVQKWAEDDVRQALAHELEHVRRGDWLVTLSARMMCAAYWFHPLAWMAWRQLRLESERACDDAVLRSADPAAYAEQLVSLAQRLLTGAPQIALSMANRGDLSVRVSAVLDRDQPRGRVGKRLATVIGTSAVLLSLVLGALTATRVHAQTPAAGASPLAFQVATVTPSKSPAPNGTGVLSGLPLPTYPTIMPSRPSGGLMTRGVPLGVLIRLAYQLSPLQMAGGPNWIESEPFDIDAKADGASDEQVRRMLRTLLAERFKLVVHSEPRALPAYALVTSPLYGGLGPRLARSTRDCTAEPPLDLHALLKVIALQVPLCGGFWYRPHYLSGTAIELSRLSHELTMVGAVDRVVLDRSGLTGPFDFEVTWSPQPDQIFTNVQEQLGLQLESTNEPVDVLVIDRAEHPTGN